MGDWREGASIYLKKWREKNPEKASEYCKTYRLCHIGIAKEQVKRYRRKVKLECIAYYSKGKMNCACCSEDNLEFLAIDHINGGGRKAQKERGHGNIHQWLRARGYPDGYRVLCHNCNMSLGFYGYCPHRVLEG